MAAIILILIAVFFFALANKESDSNYNRNTSHQKEHSFENVSKISNTAYDCTTSAGARKRLDKLDSLYDSAKLGGESDEILSHIAFERNDVRELVDDMEYSEWEDKARNTLSCFLDTFEYVTTDEYHSFRNIEDVLGASKKCIRLWYKYWSLSEGVHVHIDPKKYMREYLGDSFEPCMLDSVKLKKQLDNATEKLKPENRRKKKLYRNIIETVSENGSMMQCELLKHDFENATKKEVEYCYNDLIANYRLVKVKIGNRYFVSLSDKEKDRLAKKRSGSNAYQIT